MTGDIVSRAKAALEGVPEGPWVIERDESTHLAYDLPMYDAKQSPLAVCPDCGVRGGFEVPAAEFITAARSLVPELIAEVERMRRQPGCCCGGCVL